MPKSAKDVVTDHALLRWLERVYGVEVEYMRETLFDQIKDVAASGASQWSSDTGTFIFSFNGVLVTVLPAGTKPRQCAVNAPDNNHRNKEQRRTFDDDRKRNLFAKKRRLGQI